MDVVDFAETLLGSELTEDQKSFLLKCYEALKKGDVRMDYYSLVYQIYSQKSLAEAHTKNVSDEIILGVDVVDFLLANRPVEIKYFYSKETPLQFFGLRVIVDFENKDRVYVIPKMEY